MDGPLRVGVNLAWCLPGAVGGAEEHLARQLVGLGDVAPEIDATLVVPPGYVGAHPDVATRHPVVVAPSRSRGRRAFAAVSWLPGTLGAVDVVHHTGGAVPPRSPRPVLLSVHEVRHRPGPRSAAAGAGRLTRLTHIGDRHAVRHADLVAVPTRFVRDAVLAAHRVDPARVVVVPPGVARPTVLTPATELRERYDLGDRPFVLYPALTHAHKNHRFLLDLLAGPWSDPDLVLVLLGARGPAEDELAGEIAALELGPRVVRPGRVPAPDRDGFLAAAEALVLPSEYEGTGASVLEAMALGTPVVCSDRAALPEIAGDAALVRALELEAWVDALDEVRARRPALVEAGLARAACYTTAAAGTALAAAYRLTADLKDRP